MLFKRYLVLATGVLLFIVTFIVFFAVARWRMEDRFTQERVKFGVDNTRLTVADSASSRPGPSAPNNPASTPTPAAPDSAPISPAPPSVDNAPPSAAPDTNILIGPVPPQSSSPPDNTPAPAAPTAPDTNSAPMTPSSTRNNPRESGSPFFVLAAYRPSDGMMVQTPGFEPARNSVIAPSAPPITNPATNTGASNAGTNTGTPTTNTAPYAVSGAESGAPRPAPVQASVIVLGYHQFIGSDKSSKNPYVMKQDVFESEMKYLKDNGYHVVPLSDVVRFIKHEIGLPPNSVAITIDDGYKSAIVYAAPVLKKYGYPWTYFIYPDFITVNEGVGAASWNDLLALQADGVDIESHSMTHPFLTHHRQQIKHVWHNLSPEEYDQFLTNETAGSKALLEQKMGKPILFLAYPYGDYNKEVEAKAIAAGYEAIFTVADNPVHTTTSLTSIGRYVITQPVEKAFAGYLHQGALGIADADPAPGATITNPRPIITAVLGYAGNLDPNSIETSVRDYGVVRHDYDPKTSTLRLYLPRDLVQPVNIVNIRVKDAETGQVMVANWHFNYEPGNAAAGTHPPIGPTTNAASASTNTSGPSSRPPASASTNAASASTNAISSPKPAASTPATAAPPTNPSATTKPVPKNTSLAPSTKRPPSVD